jgi:hypothetical protein
MAKSMVVSDYKLEHTNKVLNGRLTSLLLLARFFSSALMIVASWPRAPSKRSHPLLCLHYCSFHLMFLLWVTSMLPCLTCIQDIPTKPSFGCPHPCLYFACGFIEDVGGHPMMHQSACMVRLTRLPPSKHVLMRSTTLISKIKNNFRAMGKLRHKFREVF